MATDPIALPKIYLIRHGQTEWSLTGQHTGSTDIQLTAAGIEEARSLRPRLAGIEFSRVLSSPRVRAQTTCELAGLGEKKEVIEGLAEWFYGEFEGLTGEEIHARWPGWDVFLHGAPGGESVEQMSARADRVVAELRGETGNIAVFSHGHMLRALAVRWVELPMSAGRLFGLNTASISVLGFEHENAEEPAIVRWNDDGRS